MSLSIFIDSVRTDKAYEAKLKSLAQAAQVAGRNTPEWDALVAEIQRRWERPSAVTPNVCPTTVTTITSADCLVTTTTTTWY